MEAIKQVWEGKAGLAKTYWGWGFLGGIPWSIALALAPAGSAIAILLVVAALAYCILVNVGVWRAATAYAGPPTWAMLAKVVAALGVFFVLVAAVTIGLAMSGRSLVVPGAVSQAAPASKAAPATSDDEWWKKGSTPVN